MSDLKVQDRLLQLRLEPADTTPEESSKFMRGETSRAGLLVKARHIKVDWLPDRGHWQSETSNPKRPLCAHEICEVKDCRGPVTVSHHKEVNDKFAGVCCRSSGSAYRQPN